jgi:hypothetical protein
MVDLGADGSVSVSSRLEAELIPDPASAPFRLAWPLGSDALEDLRWYLEDYLSAPFGVYDDRGVRVAGQFEVWGEAIFDALFSSAPARQAYRRLREGGHDLEVVLRSSSPALLALPWELMADPERGKPLVAWRLRSTRSCLWRDGVSAGDPDVVEEGDHVAAQGLVVGVDRRPGGGWPTAPGDPAAGQDWPQDLVSKDREGGDGA